MNIRFMEDGTIQMDNARICWRNFRGAAVAYNTEGDRNFSVIIEDSCIQQKDEAGNIVETPILALDLANMLKDMGWNVKIKTPDDPDEQTFIHLPVKIKFLNWRQPIFWLRTNGVMNKLEDEDSIGILDDVEIARVDLDIYPYDWTMPNGRSGRTARLQSICVTQLVRDRFGGHL